MKYEYFNNKWFFNDLNKIKRDIHGYNNFFREEMYNHFTKNFDLKLHTKRYQKIDKFINSNRYVLID